MKLYFKKALPFLLGSLTLASCQSFEASYEDPNSVEILDNKWNDTDARITVEQMIDSCLKEFWLKEHTQETGKRPFVLFGDFENRTDEHIDTKAMFEAVRNHLIKSRKVRFLDGAARQRLLKEYQYQGSGVVKNSQVKGPGKQKGADFFMMGAISAQKAKRGGRERITYQIEMRMTNIETSEIVWVDTKNITKSIRRSSVGG